MLLAVGFFYTTICRFFRFLEFSFTLEMSSYSYIWKYTLWCEWISEARKSRKYVVFSKAHSLPARTLTEKFLEQWLLHLFSTMFPQNFLSSTSRSQCATESLLWWRSTRTSDITIMIINNHINGNNSIKNL